MEAQSHWPKRGPSRSPARLTLKWRETLGIAFACISLASRCEPEPPPGGCDEQPCAGAGGEAGSAEGGAGGSAGEPSAGSAGVPGGATGSAGDATGVGGDAAGAPPSGGAAGQPSDGGAAGQPSSTFCGDAVRDPELEACDDGPGLEPDSCNDACEVTTLPIVARAVGLRTKSRHLGYGRHVIAAQSSGIAVTFIEQQGSEASIKLSRFDAFGRRHAAPIDVSAGAQPVDDADPVVAGLPGGEWAVAFADLANGSLDIALRRFNDTGQKTGETLANTTSTGAQHSPDLLWIGDELHAAWTDALTVKTRTFSQDLEPTSPETSLFAGELVSHVALAEHRGALAAAARRQVGSLERIDIVAESPAGSLHFETAPFVPGAPFERPALLSLSDQQLLVAFTEGTDPESTGTPNVSRLALAVLDASDPGETLHFSLPLSLEPWSNDDTLAQRRPALARAGERIFLAWETDAPDGKEHLFVQELTWDPITKDLTVKIETRFRADPAMTSPERAPSFAVTPLFPEGALALAWEETQATGQAAPDILFSLRPVPFIPGVGP
jgi:hypothetical protein